MKKGLYILPFILSVLLLFTGCNNEVFIDGPILPDEIWVNVDGDGGTSELTIPVKGLENISLDLITSGKGYCKYFDAQGQEISSDSPVSELHKIVFENDYYNFQLVKQDNRLIFTSSRSESVEVTWTFRLRYDYCMRFIYFIVTNGGPQNE